jgi:hypothetical protein
MSSIDGGVTYKVANGGRWVGFGGKVEDWHCCWPKLGMWLVDELGSDRGVVEVEAAAFAAHFGRSALGRDPDQGNHA